MIFSVLLSSATLLLSLSKVFCNSDTHSATTTIFHKNKVSENKYVPVVLWHGMGDDCCNKESMGRIREIIEESLEHSVFVYSVRIGSSPDEDRRTSFFGDLNKQISDVCEELRGVEELRDGFNAIGFSQGGQALRAYAQRCSHISPPIRNLITLGSQHMGVSDIPKCGGVWCGMMRAMIKRGVYTPSIQRSLIQAQYYHDPYQHERYLQQSIFLTDINNELDEKNALYKDNLVKLGALVMVKFADDQMVVPKESSWFEFHDVSKVLESPNIADVSALPILPLKQTQLYKEDWLGLRQLDEEGKLVFVEMAGDHLRLDMELFKDLIIGKYLAILNEHSSDSLLFQS